jgi:hypothetical protein
MKTSSELIEYIDHVVASLDADYGVIYDNTRVLLDQMPKELGDRLRWNLVHQHTALSTMLVDLKRHQELLGRSMDASKPIQD